MKRPFTVLPGLLAIPIAYFVLYKILISTETTDISTPSDQEWLVLKTFARKVDFTTVTANRAEIGPVNLCNASAEKDFLDSWDERGWAVVEGGTA